MTGYRSEFYAFDREGRPTKAVVRNYGAEDFAALIDIQRECFPPPFPSELWWTEEQLASHTRLFPEGAICVEADGKLVGSMTALIVRYDPSASSHTWAETTGNGFITPHDPAGDTLYVVDVSVRPAYRAYGFGKAMAHAMYHLVVEKRLARLLGGGRMSGYHRYADTMSAEGYAEAVVAGRLKDPVITFLLRCGRTPVRVAANYLDDEESRDYALLMEWKNPFIQL
ncbi:GNAT family N-acetyltransferase [Paenibacillus antri]|uniref:GNAT family N-acetyltransferase n=1 Tax=Paenibacillus antri TaxID=2582848 RepID=A0A5R9G9R2_9BACL|nr:GNAT family N-acetyltransferase [Paenibacillus antri]TLS49453.1 GNAT family N-acetyltransferase [Paenibacillus antri]